jgi:hypothetical protein
MITKNYICFFALLFSTPAYADSWQILAGESRATDRYRCNLQQKQSPHPQILDLRSPTWALEHTWTTNRTLFGLPIEITGGFHHKGKTDASSEKWVSDENCEQYIFVGVPTFGARFKEKSQQVLLTADLVWRDTLFFGLGPALYHDEIVVNEGSFLNETETGFTIAARLGVRYGWFVLEGIAVKHPYTTTSPGKDNFALLAGVRYEY